MWRCFTIICSKILLNVGVSWVGVDDVTELGGLTIFRNINFLEVFHPAERLTGLR